MGIYAPSFDDEEVCEVHGSPSESYDEEGQLTCSVSLQCAWADRHAVAADIVAARIYWPHGSFSRAPYATSCSIKPLESKGTGITNQSIDYDHAIITVNYGYSQGEDPEDLVSESLEPTAEFLTQDFKRFAWANADENAPEDAILEGEAPGKLVRGMNLVRTYYRIASVPGAVLSCYGCVNDASYTSALLGMTFPAETLLYSPPQLSRKITTDGSDGFDIMLKFTVKPTGWNKFWRAKTQEWVRMWDLETAAVYNNYPLADFSGLLS